MNHDSGEQPSPVVAPRRHTSSSAVGRGSSSRRRFLVTMAGVVAADQAVKHASPTFADASWVEPATNPALMLGVPAGPAGVVAVSLIAMMLFGWRCVVLVRRQQLSMVTVGLLFGGALSNLIDRLVFGEVRDQLLTGPIIWNVADLAIFIGIIGWIRTSWLNRQRTSRHHVRTATSSDTGMTER